MVCIQCNDNAGCETNESLWWTCVPAVKNCSRKMYCKTKMLWAKMLANAYETDILLLKNEEQLCWSCSIRYSIVVSNSLIVLLVCLKTVGPLKMMYVLKDAAVLMGWSLDLHQKRCTYRCGEAGAVSWMNQVTFSTTLLRRNVLEY